MEFDCHYPGSSNVTVTQSYLQSLESRLMAMERRLSTTEEDVGGVNIESNTPRPERNSSGLDILATVHDDDSVQITDGMGSLGFVKEEQTSFFGSILQLP
jgi:hypothetical protein